MPSRNGETKRETRVAKVSQEAVGRQLSRVCPWQGGTCSGCSPSLLPLWRPVPMGEIADRKVEKKGNFLCFTFRWYLVQASR